MTESTISNAPEQQPDFDHDFMRIIAISDLVKNGWPWENVKGLLREWWGSDHFEAYPDTESVLRVAADRDQSFQAMLAITFLVLRDGMEREELSSLLADSFAACQPGELEATPEYVSAVRKLQELETSAPISSLTDAPAVEWDDPILAPPQGFTVDEPKRR